MEDKVFYSVCRNNCFGGCRIKVTVRDGKIVKTEAADYPDMRYKRICSRGLSLVQRVYDPDRLQYPIKRVGERGEGKWERISWDQAIGEITDSWKKMQRESGDSSVAFFLGTGTFSGIPRDVTTRFRNAIGATHITPVWDAALYFGLVRALGVGEFFNGNEYADLVNAKTILIWGSNPADAQPQNWKQLREAQMQGAKLIVIDPNCSATAAKADVFVPLRPATDAALAMAMMNVIIQNKWTDEPFLKKRTVAPFLVKADGTYLRAKDLAGSGDAIVVWDAANDRWVTAEEAEDPALSGKYCIEGIKVRTAYDLLLERIAPYTVEYVSELCNIPESLIYEITESYATRGAASIFYGFGLDHYSNGHAAAFTICCLSMLTGNIGKPGASSGFLQLMSFNNLASPGLGKPETSRPSVTVPWLSLPDVMDKNEFIGQPIHLRSMFITMGNPIANMTERRRMIEAIKKLELIVVADMRMTDTALYADIVLPVCHWFECEDYFGSVTQLPYVFQVDKVIEPMYESKSDFDIIKLLAKGMGCGELFDMSEQDWIKKIMSTAYSKAIGTSYERLQEEKILRGISSENYVYGKERFNTPTGRAEFYLETPRASTYYGQDIDVDKERLPYWEPPCEAWAENPLAKKYPLIYCQDRKFHVHTQGFVPWINELEPEPIVKLNHEDAADRNIADGDVVRVFNDRGYVVLKAKLTGSLRKGMIMIPKGWQQWQFIDGHYQDLTSKAHNPACMNNCYFDALVEVEVYHGQEA